MTDIEKLKELEAKATKGPWSLVDNGRFLTGPYDDLVADCDYFYQPGSEENTALIVAMRNALPALLASLASKDAEIERQALALREMTFSRDTWRKVAEGRGSDIERETKIARAAESRLTTALAERDEALERAATKATSFLVGDPENGVPFRSPMPHEIADAIRKMKALS